MGLFMHTLMTGARARIFSSFQVLACGDCGSLLSNTGMPSPRLVTQTTMTEWMKKKGLRRKGRRNGLIW